MAKSTSLTSSPLHYIWWYLSGVLTLPVLGLGALLLYRIERSRRGHIIELHEQHLSIRENGQSRTIALDTIRSVRLKPSPFPGSWYGVGSLVLDAGAGEAVLKGIRGADRIKDALEAAIASLQDVQTSQQDTEAVPTTTPGGDDRMNELTLMWQQGLISEEDFQREQRHFKG